MRRDAEWYLLTGWLVLQDALLLACAFSLAYVLRFEADLVAAPTAPNLAEYAVLGGLIIVGWLGLFALHGAFRRDTLLAGYQEYVKVLNACLYGVALVAVGSFLLGGNPIVSRGYLLVAGIMAMVLVGIGRFLLRRVVWHTRRNGRFLRRALIVGTGQQAEALCRHLSPASASGVRILGFLSDFQAVGAEVVHGLRVLGSTAQAGEIAEAVGANELLVVTRAVSWEAQEQLLREYLAAPRLQVRLVPSLTELATATMQPERIGSVTLLRPERRSITGLDALLKAALDMGLSLTLLVLVSPWLLWWRVTHGPFRRVAVYGRYGRPFNMLVLPGKGMAIWIERLPALWNVVRREMSLIGPAPRRSSEWYESPSETALHGARPGLVGLVPHGATARRELRMVLELHYLQNYSIWLDLQVLLSSLRWWMRHRDHQTEVETTSMRTDGTSGAPAHPKPPLSHARDTL